MATNRRLHAILPLLAAPWFSLADARAQTIPAPGELVGPVLPKVVPDCRPTDEEDVVVCGRREQRSPYRLPLQRDGFDPAGLVDSVWRERERLMEGGETGIMSCSTVGPGGWTGCRAQEVKRSDQQWGPVSRSARRPRGE